MNNREYLLNRDIARAKLLFSKRNYDSDVVMKRIEVLEYYYGDISHDSDTQIVEKFKEFKKESLDKALYTLEEKYKRREK